MEIIKNPNSWTYKVDGYGNEMSFEYCTLGENKGKTFMKGNAKCWLVNVLENHKVTNPFGTIITIIDEIEVVKEVDYKEIFFSVAEKAKFSIEDMDCYEGYTFNQDWNGWAMPMFEREIAMKILEDMEQYKEVEGGIYLTYDEKNDTFIYHCNNNDDDVNFVPSDEKGHDIKDENGNVHHVYDIGAGFLTWSRW